jgi:hypothetical protein
MNGVFTCDSGDVGCDVTPKALGTSRESPRSLGRMAVAEVSICVYLLSSMGVVPIPADLA